MELVPDLSWTLSMDRIRACDIVQVQSIPIRNLPLAWKDKETNLPGDSLAVSEPHRTVAQETEKQPFSTCLGAVVIWPLQCS